MRNPFLIVALALSGLAALAACRGPSEATAHLEGLPTTVAQTVVEGGPAPSPLTFSVSNPGSCALAFTMTTQTVSGSSWLGVSPSAGVVAPSGYTIVTLTFNLAPPIALAPGTHVASVVVSGTCGLSAQPALRSPRSISVNLTVLPSSTRCPPDFLPIPTTCGTGACARTGTITCANGVFTNSCAPGAPAASDTTCNGIDDNCDGQVDEGYVSRVTTCGSGRCASTGVTSCVNGVEQDSCTVTCLPLPGEQANPGTSCSQILRDGGSVGDGVYWIRDGSAPARTVYCDMTTDGGGWTALYLGKNGNGDVFDHFDTAVYTGAFNDPSTGRYLQRGTGTFGDGSTDIAVSCGAAAIKFPLTKRIRDWLINGTQMGWIPIRPTVAAGQVQTLPNGLFTGDGTGPSFAFSRDRQPWGLTFASSMSNDVWSYCNGVHDSTSVTKILYREAAPTPVRNVPTAALRSCRALQEAGQSAGDGLYWLSRGDGSTYLAYCDMTTDGGGWTAFYTGRNGSQFVYDHLDAPVYTGRCTDPATNCVRRAPSFINDSHSELAVSCGDTMVGYPMTNSIRRWVVSGTPAGWLTLKPTVLRGTPTQTPAAVFTGTASQDLGFYFTPAPGQYWPTFATAYEASADLDYCNGVAQDGITRLFYREAPTAPVLNSELTAGTSCRAILLAGQALGDGVYWLQQPGEPAYKAYCDMTTDGGGWTALFSGRNGSQQTFATLDDSPYAEVCTDPATRCMRRAPASFANGQGEIAVSCGAAMVSSPLVRAAMTYVANGQESGWVSLNPKVLSGTVPNPPDALYTGTSGVDRGFVFMRGAPYGSTFASSYAQGAGYDACNGVADSTSVLRFYYREPAPTPVLNTPNEALASCRALRDAGQTRGDGLYWLQPAGSAAHLGYCDMTLDGGGWTTAFAGLGGHLNVFDHLDAPAYTGVCTDPASRCVRRAAAATVTGATELSVSCGGATLALPLTEPLRDWLVNGTRRGWIAVVARVLQGTVGRLPTTLYTGEVGGNPSFILSEGQQGNQAVFASSYVTGSPLWSYCNGVYDPYSPVRIAFRERAVGEPLNTQASAGESCKTILGAGNSLGDGLYWLAQSGGPPYLAHCDMTTNGGGWTVAFASRNGEMNVFDRLDAPGYQGICTDPATRCVRRAPTSLNGGELGVSCGDSFVGFSMTAIARNWLVNGTLGGSTQLSPNYVRGTVPLVPNWLNTGDGHGFYFAKDGGQWANVYASNNASSYYDYCNGQYDQVSLMRIYYRE